MWIFSVVISRSTAYREFCCLWKAGTELYEQYKVCLVSSLTAVLSQVEKTQTVKNEIYNDSDASSL
jgi:hypothetical protein